jgi:hypothetical protein
VAGSGNGALDTGSTIPAAAWLHVFLIMRTDTGVVDVLVSQSATAPTLPTNYTKKRRIGSIKTASSAILAFTQLGDEFLWQTLVIDVNTSSITASTSYTINVPTGLKVVAHLTFVCSSAANNTMQSVISSPDQLLTAWNNPGGQQSISAMNSGTLVQNGIADFYVRTNTSGQINVASSATGGTVVVITRGWVDNRGK